MGVIISGSNNVTVNGIPMARQGDPFQSNSNGIGTIIQGSPDVTQSAAVARVGDQVKAGSVVGVVTSGSPNVTCDGKPVARVGDSTSI